MGSTRLTFAALAIACVTAAAAGGYIAKRQNTPGTPAISPVAASPDVAVAPQGQPVRETEGIIAEAESVKPQADSPRRPTPGPAAKVAAPKSASAAAPPRSSPPKTNPAPVPAPEPVQNTPSPIDVPPPAAARAEELHAPDVFHAPEPPARRFEELVVSADSVIGLQMDTAVSSERARVEDRVEAHVVRDVKVGDSVAVPAGSRAIGSVMVVERGGKLKDRARLGIRFHTLVLADGTRLPITTETLYRSGEAPGNGSAAKIGGGAAAGAILGAIIGGAKGAAIGGTVGAGAGTAAVMNGDRSAATFPAATDVTARILSPVTVTVEK